MHTLIFKNKYNYDQGVSLFYHLGSGCYDNTNKPKIISERQSIINLQCLKFIIMTKIVYQVSPAVWENQSTYTCKLHIYTRIN